MADRLWRPPTVPRSGRRRKEGGLRPRYRRADPEKQFDTVMAVKSEIFPAAPYPNWTAIGVNWLAGFDFEIKVIARIPGETQA
jgi:hypothetical protein